MRLRRRSASSFLTSIDIVARTAYAMTVSDYALHAIGWRVVHEPRTRAGPNPQHTESLTLRRG